MSFTSSLKKFMKRVEKSCSLFPHSERLHPVKKRARAIPCVEIEIRTEAKINDWAYGKKILQPLMQWNGLLVPVQMSHCADNFRSKWAAPEPFMSIDDAQRKWAVNNSNTYDGIYVESYKEFAWQRKKKLKCSGRVWHQLVNTKGNIGSACLDFSSDYNKEISWLSLFKEWCEIFPTQLGVLHYRRGRRPRFIIPGEEMVGEEADICFGALIAPTISNIGWAMYYGDEFATAVDEAKIRKAGFPIEKIGNGYLVRVTENIEDVQNDFEDFVKRRAELRKLFPPKFFLCDIPPGERPKSDFDLMIEKLNFEAESKSENSKTFPA